MKKEIPNANVVNRQREVFNIYEEYTGKVVEIGEARVFVLLDCGAYGSIATQNVPAENFKDGETLRLKIIGFITGGILDMIPCETWLQEKQISLPDHSATVQIVSRTGIVLSFCDFSGKETGVYNPPKGLGDRWSRLIPGQKVICKAYETHEGIFVNGIISVERNGGNIRNFNQEIYDGAIKNKSLPERKKLKLGHIYTAKKFPTKTYINGELIALDIPKEFKVEDFATLEVVITFIPKSNHKCISATVVSILENKS